MTDPLEILWPSVDAPEPLFTADEVAKWPASCRERLEDLGILRRAENAAYVACPGCNAGHVEEVVARNGPDGHARFFVWCPESLRVEVPEDRLLQWTIDFGALAQAVACGMTLKGRVTERLVGRLWRLGKAPWPNGSRGVFLARGLSWPNGHKVAERIGSRGRPIVFVADRAPPLDLWPDRPPAVVSLAEMSRLTNDRIELDLADIAARVGEADGASHAANSITLGEGQATTKLRRLIRSVQKSTLTEDALVAAYVLYGSYRKAADGLKEQGYDTDRWAVERAVRNAGGVEAVKCRQSSHSVVRTVASQRRDGRKTIRKSP